MKRATKSPPRRAGKDAPRRRIAVVTGTRADYGLLRSTMQAIRAHDNLELQVVACGMHLLPGFGRTVRDIVADGFHIDARVRMQKGDDSPTDQAKGLARGITGIARFLDEAASEAVVVLGDRIEAMAGALAAVTTGCTLAHIHGGDMGAGDFDDQLRHAITQLAALHFPATDESAERIVGMGIPRDRVFIVGAPGLDRILELAEREPPPKKPSGRALVIQHACGRSPAVEKKVMQAILRAVAAERLAPTLIYPNTDRGHTGVLQAMEEYLRKHKSALPRIHRSLPRDNYLRELMRSDVIVGNSSSGIIESASAGTPAVNVGPRQSGRQRCGPSVLDADETVASIRSAIRRAAALRPTIDGPSAYGDGGTGPRIAQILSEWLGNTR